MSDPLLVGSTVLLAVILALATGIRGWSLLVSAVIGLAIALTAVVLRRRY